MQPRVTGLTLAVDDLARAGHAGAATVKPAQTTFCGGYAGYFQDPDQHLWEVVWNPHGRDTSPSTAGQP